MAKYCIKLNLLYFNCSFAIDMYAFFISDCFLEDFEAHWTPVYLNTNFNILMLFHSMYVLLLRKSEISIINLCDKIFNNSQVRLISSALSTEAIGSGKKGQYIHTYVYLQLSVRWGWYEWGLRFSAWQGFCRSHSWEKMVWCIHIHILPVDWVNTMAVWQFI